MNQGTWSNRSPASGTDSSPLQVASCIEQGIEKTTLADIAQAADVPVGNIYYYFKTKDELVRAVVGGVRGQISGQGSHRSIAIARPRRG